jgi:uncharacterized membrane protein
MARAKLKTSDWLIPAGLLFLSIAPLLGGVVRLNELATGAVTVSNARFFAAPIPIVVHALSSLLYFMLGAFQFSPAVRNNHPRWHRSAGRVLIPSGILCAATGVWMAQLYPPFIGDGTALRWIRTVVGVAMIACIASGWFAIQRRKFDEHRAWMMRAYALAIAAGTQAFTLIPFGLIPAARTELGYTLGLAAGWAMNLTIAEYLIRRNAARKEPVRLSPQTGTSA